MIPLFVDCSRRRIVIFGGGDVAERKARFFSKESAVTVVSRSFTQKITELAVKRIEGDVAHLTDDAVIRMVSGVFLVVGALSDPNQNDRIGRLCREKGILFNNADGEPGDVIIPSVTKGKNYTIAVSTGGSSPAISRFIREDLEAKYPALDAMIALQDEVRERLRAKVSSQPERNAILREILHDTGVWTLLAEDPAQARVKIQEKYNL
jgi:precorrin-2 dehydrogenase/sirohydrochlorin ferrochelatase